MDKVKQIGRAIDGVAAIWVLLVLWVLGPAAAYGAAAPATFEQEWSKLIDAAKQEGTLSVASGGAPSIAIAICPEGLLVCTLPLNNKVRPTKSRTNSFTGCS